MSQRQDRELQLKFWSKTTERNVVSVAVLTQSLQSLQRAVHLLGMHHEGKEVRQRARLSDEIKKRYVVLCQLPEEGSYTVPVMIGDTSQSLFAPVAVEAVTGNFHDLLSAIADKDGVRIRAVLPDHSYRISILRALRKMEPPKRSGVELALQSRSGDDVLGATSRNGKNRTLRPIERRAGPEFALFNLLVQPPAMAQTIVGKELDRLGHARVGVPGSGRSCSPKRSRCGDRAWRSPEPSLSGRTL